VLYRPYSMEDRGYLLIEGDGIIITSVSLSMRPLRWLCGRSAPIKDLVHCIFMPSKRTFCTSGFFHFQMLETGTCDMGVYPEIPERIAGHMRQRVIESLLETTLLQIEGDEFREPRISSCHNHVSM
jgi:hypothetical protein